MNSPHTWARVGLLTIAGLLLLNIPGRSQLPARDPRASMKAVAETSLLMKGIHSPNFRGLERLLKTKPDSKEAWEFAKGRALLIAEGANLLLLRPPEKDGRVVWTQRSVELRVSATVLAKFIAQEDHPRSRSGLIRVSKVCNRCHVNFRVTERLTPFATE